jgi:hypothetical protein
MREINNLWYIAHIENLASIFTIGILCRSVIKRLGFDFEDISLWGVQRRRRQFHTYVPLFIADNTPMLYTVVQQKREEICLLKIDKKILEQAGVRFADGNIASDDTRIYESLDFISEADWKILLSRYAAYSRSWKRIRSAEVLVPSRVLPEFIKSISVASNDCSDRVNKILHTSGKSIPIKVNLSAGGVT